MSRPAATISPAALVLVFLAALALGGCAHNHGNHDHQAMGPGSGTVFFNLTSDPAADAHSLTMAMQLAGHALDAGRRVVLFFNVKAVGVPTRGFDAELAYHDKPLKNLLAGLILRGALVHVCPHCMEAQGVKEEQLIAGARVTTRESLFAELGPKTVVFTY